MVEGIESFREKFRDYTDCYTVIGGAACDILMSEAEIAFRATKDIDMILILEDKKAEFAKAFWKYIRDGGYRCGWKNNADVHFYRFTEPLPGFPAMIELFSRKPGYHLDVAEGIIPIHIDDDTPSLSAILLKDDFYNFMLAGRKTASGVSVLDAEHIIPFKMYAWLDLRDRKQSGEHVNERDLKKHKYDVFRLLQIVDRSITVDAPGRVKDDIIRFQREIVMENIPFRQLGPPFEMEEALGMLRALYGE